LASLGPASAHEDFPIIRVAARVIPVLNGLLYDPDEEIREGAKDALKMLQSQPALQ
jgi:hypothetical protein